MALPSSSSPERAPAASRAAVPGRVTASLAASGAGDPAALDALLPSVYAELRRQAGRALRREAVGHTLQPTALVHEVYLRLAEQDRMQWRGRAHFCGVAAQLMRRILVDHARARHAAKRGGAERVHVTLRDDEAGADPEPADSELDVLALHGALERLRAMDPELARLVECRYFGGLSIADTADALGMSPATVKRHWQVARGWLRRELRPERPSDAERGG